MKKSPHKSGPSGSDGERILQPIRQRHDWPRNAPDDEGVRRVLVLDTETTGLDAERHKMIEIAAAIVLVNDAGRIAAVEYLKSGLIDPGHPLPRQITEITGLSDADLAGQSVCQNELTRFIECCDAVVAFNSGFDRPFVENYLPSLRPMPWGCAMKDVQWRQLGFEPGPQNYLLQQTGWYAPSAHRAADDVLALIQLLDHVCNDGESVMAKVLTAINEPAWRFEAKGAPYGYRHDLRDQRYRWAPGRAHKIWHKHVRLGEYQDELDWYEQTIGQKPAIVPLPATQRYRGDHTWLPA